MGWGIIGDMFAPDPAEVVSANTAFSSFAQILVAVFTAFITVWVKYDQRKHSKELRTLESKIAVRDDEAKQRNAALVRFQSEHALKLYESYMDLVLAWRTYMEEEPFIYLRLDPVDDEFEATHPGARAEEADYQRKCDELVADIRKKHDAFCRCFEHKRVFLSPTLDGKVSSAVETLNELRFKARFPNMEEVGEVYALVGPVAEELRREIRALITQHRRSGNKGP